ncbi:fumarylacetoacetate hydrolase family protein [Arthrobacter sp. UYEF21]|uniref:fumarylacetoacetate hydrolase family protein n=1 Tax=Arthrobacter sp. UYEF21 TaxID=1756364 RepID=UPI00339438FA
MKFARLGPVGAETPAIMNGGSYYSLAGLTPDLNPNFWSSGGPGRAAAALAAGELPKLDAVSLRIGAPITRPSSVFCVGLNYAAHAAESGSEPPVAPILFQKAANTVVGPNDAVVIPRASTTTDWEVELGVVIGTRASYLNSPSDALSHIAGFVTVNDLSERTFQLEGSGGQWSKGKSCAGFCPTGPYLVTPEEVDPGDLRLRTWVNGEPRQDSTTQDLIFDVATIIHDLSQYLVLEAGDLICTGTPEGVALSGRFPYLKAGDVVEVEVAGLGRQRQEFIQA